MEAQLEEGTIRVELPFKLTVEKTGELDPGKEIFKFMAEEFGAPVEYEGIRAYNKHAGDQRCQDL